jgi:hypothetical protein
VSLQLLRKSLPKISPLKSSPNLKRVPAQVKRNRTRNQKLTTTTEVTVTTTSLMLALEPAVMPPKSLPSTSEQPFGIKVTCSPYKANLNLSRSVPGTSANADKKS